MLSLLCWYYIIILWFLMSSLTLMFQSSSSPLQWILSFCCPFCMNPTYSSLAYRLLCHFYLISAKGGGACFVDQQWNRTNTYEREAGIVVLLEMLAVMLERLWAHQHIFFLFLINTIVLLLLLIVNIITVTYHHHSLSCFNISTIGHTYLYAKLVYYLLYENFVVGLCISSAFNEISLSTG